MDSFLPSREFADARYRRHAALIDLLTSRLTVRVFDQADDVPRLHVEQILQAASLAPSGGNAQPWHYIVIRSPWIRRVIADYFRGEPGTDASSQSLSALETAPGCIVVATDFRLAWAFPGLMEGTELDQKYHAHAERIILQSVAASTMAAHLAATALGYQTCWLSLAGHDQTQAAMHPLLGVPEDLTLTDILLFGHAACPPMPRWKKTAADIGSWDRFDMAQFRSVEEIDAWMADCRSRGASLPPAVEPPSARPITQPGGPSPA